MATAKFHFGASILSGARRTGRARPARTSPRAVEGRAISLFSERKRPSTSLRRTPSTSLRRTPSTSLRRTPSTSLRRTPSTSLRRTPSTARGVPTVVTRSGPRSAQDACAMEESKTVKRLCNSHGSRRRVTPQTNPKSALICVNLRIDPSPSPLGPSRVRQVLSADLRRLAQIGLVFLASTVARDDDYWVSS